MADEFRICSRAGCRQSARASLSFRYDTRQVWVIALTTEPEASCYDLCDSHAEKLTVPQGWQRIDERAKAARTSRRARAGRHPAAPAHATVSVPATAADPGAGVATSTTGTPPPACAAPRVKRDRYAALRADLPRLAAEVGTTRVVREQAVTTGERADGQLAIPVESVGKGAVVVSIDRLASARRRAGRDERTSASARLTPEPTGS